MDNPRFKKRKPMKVELKHRCRRQTHLKCRKEVWSHKLFPLVLDE